MSHDEDEWIRTMVKQHDDLERARRIQPGRGHRVQQARSDWWILAAILIGLALGLVL